MASPAELIVSSAAVLAAATLILLTGLKVGRFVRRITHFLDDWTGEAARPGFPARPGVMERLADLEQRMTGVEKDTRQLRPNGGSHMRDAVDRIDRVLRDRDTTSAAPTATAVVVASEASAPPPVDA